MEAAASKDAAVLSGLAPASRACRVSARRPPGDAADQFGASQIGRDQALRDHQR